LTLTVEHIGGFNETLFEQLFKQYFSSLCLFARKYVKDVDVAKEIVHDVFVNLWDKREQMDMQKSVKSYLFTSVNNRCLNYIRDNKKFNRNIEDVSTLEMVDTSNVTEKIAGDDLQQRIDMALQLLPEKCREVFMLSRFSDMKYNDIAEQLNISVKTVEAQMTKALKILREQLKDYLITITILFLSLFK